MGGTSLGTLMKIFLFLIIISIVATNLVLSTTADVTSGVISDGANNANSIFAMIGMFFKIITFQVVEIPLVINLIVFQPIALGMVYVIVMILKDLVPFT